MKMKLISCTTKLMLLTSTLLIANESFAGKRSCTDLSRLRSIAPLQNAVASGSRTIDIDVGGFREGAVTIHVAPADSMALEQLVGKSFGYGATPHPLPDPSVGTSFRASGMAILGSGKANNLTLYSIGSWVRSGAEHFLRPGEKYKLLLSTYSQLRTNCLVHYDSTIKTVQLNEPDQVPVVPSISLIRYGIDPYYKANGNLMPKFQFQVKSSAGIINYRILLNGAVVERMNPYWMGVSLNQRGAMNYQDGFIISEAATKVPQTLEIEVTTLDGVVEVLKQDLIFANYGWIGQ